MEAAKEKAEGLSQTVCKTRYFRQHRRYL